MERNIRRRKRHSGRSAAPAHTNRVCSDGECQYLRRNLRNILVLHDEAKLQARSCSNVDSWRLLQKRVVSHIRLSELRKEPGYK
jgi:hypothetical protein